MDDRIKKLPKWAQQEILHAKGDARRWKEKYQTLAGEVKTKIQVDGRFDRDADVYLPDHSTVSFRLTDDTPKFKAIDISIVKGALRIYADDMVVFPVASNSIYIKQARYED